MESTDRTINTLFESFIQVFSECDLPYIRKIIQPYIRSCVSIRFFKGHGQREAEYKQFFAKVNNDLNYKIIEADELRGNNYYSSFISSFVIKQKDSKIQPPEPIKVFALYYWFHAFEAQKEYVGVERKDTYANKIDTEILEKYPEIESELTTIKDAIAENPKQPVYFGGNAKSDDSDEVESPNEEIEATEEENNQFSNDAQNVSHETSSIHGSDISRIDCEKELTEEEKEKIVDEISKLADGELVYVDFHMPTFENETDFISGEISCDKGYVELEFDGIGYKFIIHLKEVKLHFKSENIELEEIKAIEGSFDKYNIYYTKSKRLKKITIEANDNHLLIGNFFRSTNNCLYEAKLLKGKANYSLSAQHELKADHIVIKTISKPYYKEVDVNKQNFISKMIEEEVTRVCNGTSHTCDFSNIKRVNEDD